MTVPHRIEIRVYYEDTDFSGFVYHANYVRFLERGRTEFLRALGVSHTALYREQAGLVFVVARLTIDYVRPARLDDLLNVTTSVALARGPVVRMRQQVLRGDEVLTEADVTVVLVRDGRAVRLPEELKAMFEQARTAE